MSYDPLLSRSDLFHNDLFSPHRQMPLDSITLGDAYNLCREDGAQSGRISEESFRKIRAFRVRMAEWDRKYGHWMGCDDFTKGAPANEQR